MPRRRRRPPTPVPRGSTHLPTPSPPQQHVSKFVDGQTIGQLSGELVDGQTIICQLTGEFLDGQTTGQLTGEFLDGQTIGQLTGEFLDGQTIGQLTGEFLGGQTIGQLWRIPRRTDNWSTHWRGVELTNSIRVIFSAR